MSYETILFERRNGVATLTLNRPKVYNALNMPLLAELNRALDEVDADASIRVLLLTGAGRAFCGGADLGSSGDVPAIDYESVKTLPAAEREALLRQMGDSARDSLVQHHNQLALRLHQLEKPVVCAVNGTAAGGGVGLALSCDIVIAARSARFVQVFVPNLALVPDFGCSWHLTRALGATRNLALTLLGEPLSAEDAERCGLIWKTVDDAALMSAGRELAERLARNASLANALAKRAVQQAQHNTLAQQLDLEAELQGRCGGTMDFIEGLLAFQQKRKPHFNQNP